MAKASSRRWAIAAAALWSPVNQAARWWRTAQEHREPSAARAGSQQAMTAAMIFAELSRFEI
jgi:hypothetical protein